ncbi:aminotransferase class I/II-fold pyridoxal phosphate-dependent enzyme [Microbacterium excoecariae]|uniref:aminotransferase class I/II-fold pyridoxal phosphate-dependent enzyme n=1 Tax=Microbacterium excoecariae TaxID=2715210 RepID=UPI00140DE9F2|nr:aminotransferase class I/II-fold pyridoxal phosphate-dependent enzyme [Microbacterium excoecariae]NHI15783.1 aminotransferase class I/II-fold pyridoxal phosphate-dependent enzyme [Microbacterium excoecariae]
MPIRFRAAHDQIPTFARADLPEDLVRACFNEPHVPPLPGLEEAIRAEIPRLNEYGSALDAARAAVGRAHGRAPEEVLFGSGSMDLIRALVGAVCEPGDEVLFSWPTFEGYVSACHTHGATPVTVPATPDGAPDVAALAAALTPRTRVVIVATPENPSGRALTGQELERLVAAIPGDVVLALDEAYSDFATSPRARFGAPVFGDAIALPDGAVVLRTLSKAAGLASLRVGYALARPEIIAGLAKMRTENGVDRLAIAATAFCFSNAGLDAIDERVAWIVAERQRIERTLRDRMERAEAEGEPSIPVPHSDGNFVWLPVGERAEELAAELRSTARILARAFPGLGVRYTVVEAEHNDRFIDAVSAWATTTR